MANIKRQGVAPFNSNADYQVFRNVKDFGAKGMRLDDVPYHESLRLTMI